MDRWMDGWDRGREGGTEMDGGGGGGVSVDLKCPEGTLTAQDINSEMKGCRVHCLNISITYCKFPLPTAAFDYNLLINSH